MLNASARKSQIYIGDKDYSSCFILFQGSDSHLDQSGLISFRGSMTFGKSLGFDESLDDRKNYRFFRGQRITINILNSQGIFVRHPRGALVILSSKYDESSQRLSLEVGDEIALLDFREPTNSEDAEIALGGNGTAGSIITRLLNKAGITSINGSLPSTLINYPINLSGSYLSNVGKLLYANNCFGWIDRNRVFQIRQANINSGAIATIINIGQDEISYQRLDASESPCEIIKAVGRATTVREVGFKKDISEQYGPASTIDPDYGNFSIVIKRTTITEEWDSQQKILTTTTDIEQPLGMVMPASLQSEYLSKALLIPSQTIIETKKYETSKPGKLLSITKEIYQPEGVFIEEFLKANKNYIANIYVMIPAFVSIQTYNYDTKERLSKITLVSDTIAGQILTGTDEDWKRWIFAPTFLTQSEYRVDSWEETSKNIWAYEYFTYKPLVSVKPESAKVESGTSQGTAGPPSNKLNIVYAEGDRQTSTSGQLAPSAPERRPPDYTVEEEDLEAKVQFSVFGASSLYRTRERTFNVEFLAGEQAAALRPGRVQVKALGGSGSAAKNQLTAIAQREGRLLLGRSKGQEISTAINDDWLNNYHPLMTVRVNEQQDGTGFSYLADGTSWVVGNRRALVSCDGVWVGSYNNDGTVTKPYNEILTFDAGAALGIDFIGFNWGFTNTSATEQLGKGFGINFRANKWDDVDWDNVIWDTLC